MYIALSLAIAGIFIGRFLHGLINDNLLTKLIFMAILFLLLLLGIQIGSNDRLFSHLPLMGGQALCLMLFCVAGSILAVKLLSRVFARRSGRNSNAR